MKTTRVSAILALCLCLLASCGQMALAGTIAGWGDNANGKATPPAGSDYVVIAAGGHHGLALKADGSIVGWGYNSHGQADPCSGNDYVAIDGGLAHSIALKANGSIVGWGFNAYGQADPPAGSDYVAIAAGGWHGLALKRDGTIVGWGEDGHGQATPPAGNDYAAISADGRHSLALKADGDIVSWGVSDGGIYDFGQVTDAPTDSNYVAIAAGWYHCLALKTDGSIVAWGISDGSGEDYGQVTDTPDGNDFVAIVAGHWHNLALKADGSIVGWGRDNHDQAKSPAGNDFVALGAGGDYSLALTKTAIGTGFVYQGRLIDDDYPADGPYDFRFELYNDMTAGMQEGNSVYRSEVDVTDGYFTVEIDFGRDVFDSNAVWLDIGVRPGGFNDSNVYTRLRPRQRVTPTPYAVYAESAGGDGDWAISGTDMYSIPSGNVGIGTMSPEAKLHVSGGDILLDNQKHLRAKDPSGSIWPILWLATDNSLILSHQGGGDLMLGTTTNPGVGYPRLFITSDGNVGIGTRYPSAKLDVDGDINTDSTYKIDGFTVLSRSGYNLKVGFGAGEDSKGTEGTFVGCNAGHNNDANRCTFLGWYAGSSNNTGSQNTFVGWKAGLRNTEGHGNTFLGTSAGFGNTEGIYNTFVGLNAGMNNTTGSGNTSIGFDAGFHTDEGSNNTALGYGAGYNNDGSGNVFIGYKAGYSESGSNKLHIANSYTETLIYGEFDKKLLAIDGSVGIGTMSPTAKLEVAGNIKTTGLYENISGNIGIGTTSPGAKLDVSNAEDTDLIMFSTSGTNRFSITAHGSGSDYLSIRSKFENPDTDIAVFRGDGRVGIGTTTPQQTMHISGVMRLEPQSSPPSGALGDLYVGTDGKLYFHNGTQWKEVSLL